MSLGRAAALALLLLALRPAAAAAATAATGRVTASSVAINAAGQPLLTPSKYTSNDGRAVYFEIPAGLVRGTLALFHGCVHDASDFWPRANCPECDGLPEEVAHTRQALARGYAVFAIDAASSTRCFGVHADRAPVAAALGKWLADHKLQSKPLYAAGISSGGAFALKLPQAIPVHGVISEVVGVELDGWDAMRQLGPSYPPTVYLSMPRDSRTAERIALNMGALRGLGVPTDMLEILPQPVTPFFLSSRSEAITPDVSAKVAAALQQIGLLDGNYSVTQDPRYTSMPWRQQLPALVPELAQAQDSLQPDASHIGEELNVAWAGHEIVGEHVSACLAFLESRGTVPFAGLAQQFASIGLSGPRLVDLRPQRLFMSKMRVRGLMLSGGGGAAGAQRR